MYSERRLRTEDSNEGFLVEQVQATAFVAHPYQIPTVGWPADIQGWKIEDLQKFFKTNYAPNNCTLILVGDLSAPKKASRWRRNTSSRFRGRSRRRRCAPPSPSSSARSACWCERDAQTPLLYYAYKSPGGERPAGPGHQSAHVRAHRRQLLAPASPAGGGEEARHRSAAALRRKDSIRASPGCSSRCPKAPNVGEVEKVLDAALDAGRGAGRHGCRADARRRISTRRRSGSSSPPSTARRAC